MTGRGGGKLLMFGEHAAVYGYPAVGIAFPAEIRVEIAAEDPPASGASIWEFENVNEEFRPTLERLGAACEEAVPTLSGKHFHIRIQSSIAPGVGFGSSGALCVAMAEALLGPGTADSGDAERLDDAGDGPMRSGKTSRAQVWKLAHRLEKVYHGTPSGIDTGLAALGGLRIFRPSPPGLPSATALEGVPFFLLAGYIPRTGNTGGIIGSLRERMIEGDESVARNLADLGGTADEALLLLTGPPSVAGESVRPAPPAPSHTAAALGELADRAQDLLAKLELSSERTNELLAAGRAAGATGGKLSGAGAGGAFFLIVPDRETLARCTEALLRYPSPPAELTGIYWDGRRMTRVE